VAARMMAEWSVVDARSMDKRERFVAMARLA
jgi:hypothetical protein